MIAVWEPKEEKGAFLFLVVLYRLNININVDNFRL